MALQLLILILFLIFDLEILYIAKKLKDYHGSTEAGNTEKTKAKEKKQKQK